MLNGITVITNTVNVAMELSSCKNIDVLVTGGLLRGNWFTLVGPLANHAAQSVFPDIMFIGVDGIDAKRGLTCTHPHEAEFLTPHGCEREKEDRGCRSQQDRQCGQVAALFRRPISMR